MFDRVVFALVCISFLFNSCNVKNHTVEEEKTKVFKQLESSTTGVDFINHLESDIESRYNVFDFDYFYNGSGVATVDINNDGLLDIFFTANQAQNRLYLNLGNLKFEDITEGSGVNKGKGWSTGVSFVDINRDGWQDLYVSQGGPRYGEKSRNLLFINQQNRTFLESAVEYGLADESITSQSAFFDFDKDGDLDCIVMNENLLYGRDPKSFYELIENNHELAHHSSNHLYINENGTYRDITEEAGMLTPAFGLGLMVSDINDDGWLDVYIANDYYVPDAMFINNQNGTFTNKIADYTNHVSFFGMGVDISDLNSDTHSDIFVLDMASSDHYRSKTLMASMNVKAFNLLVDNLNLHYQYMFNSLQLNVGNGFFKNIAHLTGLSKSDWSWAVLLNDFDNNTTNDVFITNGYRKYALNNDVRSKVLEAREKYNNNVPLQVKREIYDQMPSEKLSNLLFKNVGNLQFQDVSQQWGVSTLSFSNGAAYADLDNDGDLDLVVNNIDEEAFLYQNMAVEDQLGNFLKVKFDVKSQHSYAKVTISSFGIKQKKESNSVRGYLSAMDPSIHFGLGNSEKIDTLIVEWLSGKTEIMFDVPANQEIVLYEVNARKTDIRSGTKFKTPFKKLNKDSLGIEFRHIENSYDDFEIETLLPYKQSNLGPQIAVGDVNNDGLDDFYIGGAIGQSGKLFVQTTKGTFSDATPDAISQDFLYEDMGSVFFDIDNDGDDDLYVVSGGYEFEASSDNYQDRLYINNGFGRYQRAIDSSLLVTRLSGKSVSVLDYNQDGLKDIVIGTRIFPGKYPVSDRSIFYKNTGSSLVNVTNDVIPALNHYGMINKIIATDFNNDGMDDLIVVGEWTGIGIFKNLGGYFEDISSTIGLSERKGWWFSLAELDINNDSLPDYIVGNLGLNSKYSASLQKPLRIYASDFDENGTWDVVLSNSYRGDYVPLRGRECSSGQMPFIAEEFPTYDLFAKATIEEVYGEALENAYRLEANNFSSILLLNKGNENFEVKSLPIQAQIAPILDVEVLDINDDGFDDIVVLGTIHETEVETPRLDMGSGMILLSNGKDGFYFKPEWNRQVRITGNLKSIKRIVIGDEEHLIVGKNDSYPSILSVISD
ncbi:MAG: VCBS repeat-containing protein [Bacteroidota bacterium]